MEGGMLCICNYGGFPEIKDGIFKYIGGESRTRYIGRDVSFEHFVNVMEDVCGSNKNKSYISIEYFVLGISSKVYNNYDYQTMFPVYHTNPQKPLQVWITEHSKSELPYNYGNIIKDADSPFPNYPTKELLHHLRSGVLLSEKMKKYWIDESGSNCFTLFPRYLWIAWGSDKRCWRWDALQGIVSDGVIEVAELLKVAWFDISGIFHTSYLTPETTYEVVFEVMLKNDGYGWENPVVIFFELTDGNVIGHKEQKKTFASETKGKWIELNVGEFRTKAADENGPIKMGMYERTPGKEKGGFVIKGITIRPPTKK